MPIVTDFSDERNRLVTIERFVSEHRKKTLFFAVGIHLFVTFMLAFPLSFFNFNKHEEIYTVNLFDAVESPPTIDNKPPPPPPPPAKETPPPKVTPPVEKIIEKPIEEPIAKPVITETVPPVPVQSESTEPAEVISLKPRQVKKDLKPKKPAETPKIEEKKIDQALDRIKANLNRQKEMQKAREMEAEAAVAADEAVAKLRQAIRSQRPSGKGETVSSTAEKSTALSSTSTSATGSGSNSELDAALKLYYIAVSNKIHEHWILPALQEWKNDLKSVIVVHVQRDGTVTDHYFEEKSANPYFDQFVEKTLKESLPLPPFPPGINEDSLEIGLVFHPSGME
ncbi:MAG: energy transducer TonB [Pseudomonadota bacterium]